MSLNFDYSKVATLPNGDDPKHEPGNTERWHPVGEALVWASLSVGLGVLDDKTIDKWEQRLNILQAMDGPYCRWTLPNGEKVKGYITRADLEAFKGLRTNVSSDTDAQFLKKLLRSRPGSIPGKDEKAAFVKAHEVIDAWAAYRKAKGSDALVLPGKPANLAPRDVATQRAEDGHPDA